MATAALSSHTVATYVLLKNGLPMLASMLHLSELDW